MFWIAMARLKVSRPVDRASEMGWRNRPKDCRAPIPMATVTELTRMMSFALDDTGGSGRG